jgi:hypothetical protein
MRKDAMACCRSAAGQDTIGTFVMSETKPSDRVLPEHPAHRPLERFWPYAELSEQPAVEELAKLDPELRDVLFGKATRPFSISVEFPEFEGEQYARAVELAKASDEYLEVRTDGTRRHRARFIPGDRPLRIRDCYDLVCGVEGVEVLIDDRPLPYARDLWLPLVWFLIR